MKPARFEDLPLSGRVTPGIICDLHHRNSSEIMETKSITCAMNSYNLLMVCVKKTLPRQGYMPGEYL